MELLQLRDSAMRYFKQRWPWQSNETIEDFGQYCVEQWLAGRERSTPYKLLGIDFLRRYVMKTGERGSMDFLCQPRTVLKELNKEIEDQQKNSVDDINHFTDYYLFLNKRLSVEQRVTLVLYFKWGFYLKEIGDALGVTESRASQILKDAVEKQKIKLLNDQKNKRHQ